MPELPEVETVCRVVKDWIKDKRVKEIYVYYPLVLENSNEKEINAKLQGERVLDILRLGKYLIFKFENYSLTSHLRMEGKWHFGYFKGEKGFDGGIEFDPLDKVSQNSKHVHFVIRFDDDKILMYHDVRKFGRLELFDKLECYNNKPLNKLGYEPFNSLLTSDYLLAKAQSYKGSIKKLLLDQSIILGLGNIYADEVLFASRILPSLNASMLTKEDFERIIENSIIILNEAIEKGGSSVKSYHSSNSVDGKFQTALKVYGKENTKCSRCDGLINKVFLNGRGTHFCLKCQKEDSKVRIVAISGFIGSGKSLVSDYFNKLNYELLDCDKISHLGQKTGGALYDKIIKIFKGYNILNEDLSLNRDEIRFLILKDSKLNKKLKEETHKYVYNYIVEEVFFNPSKKYVIDVPILFESNIDKIVDKKILVKVDDDLLLDRLEKRNKEKFNDYKKFIELQKENNDPNKYDYVIYNNGSKKELEEKVKDLAISLNI